MEVVLDADKAPINEEEIVHGSKVEKVENTVKKSKGKSTIKGLHFDNIVVVYKDEIGKLAKEKFSMEIPEVEKEWQPVACRKMLSVLLDENNITPSEILTVSLPSVGGKEIDIDGSFLEKQIGQLSKKEVVNAAIYYRLRTVASALHADAEEMQHSLWLHMCNKDKQDSERFLRGISQWEEKTFDSTAIVSTIK